VQTEDYWRDITLPIIEVLRKRLRALIQFIDRSSIKPVYSVFTDEIGNASEIGLKDFSTGINLAQYRRKVERYIRDNENHVVIAKLRFNKPLTPTDLSELERFVYESDAVGGREQFVQGFGDDRPLTVFVRSLVGLDRNAAKEAFGQFLDANRFSSQQIRFVEMIIERLTQRGIMDPAQLYEPPFTTVHHLGVDGAFGDADAQKLVDALNEVKQRAIA